jgi:outer membrane protein insertion porin family
MYSSVSRTGPGLTTQHLLLIRHDNRTVTRVIAAAERAYPMKNTKNEKYKRDNVQYASARHNRLSRLRRSFLLPYTGLNLLALASIAGYAAPTEDTSVGMMDAARTATLLPHSTIIIPQNTPPTGQTTLPPTVQPVVQSTIGQIIVLGNRSLSETAIVLMSGHKEGDPCTQQTLDEMRINLLQKGYFGLHSVDLDAAVKVRVEGTMTPGARCKVVIEVDENDRVANINIAGSGPIKPTEIVPLLHLKPGVVYNPLQFRRDYDDIQQLYNRRGYTVTPAQDAGFDEKGVLNVDLKVARVSEIHIEGNHRTRAKTILREMRTRIGGYYNAQMLEQDRERLLNIGLFDGKEGVEISTRNLGAGEIGIIVQVKEQKSVTLQGGFSYSERDQLVGDVSVSDHNFQGMGESVSLTGALGATTGRHSLELDYRKPWLDNHATGLTLSIYDKNVNRFANNLYNATPTGIGAQGGSYSQQHTGGSVTLSRPLGQTLRAALTVRGEETTTDPLGLTGVNTAIVQDGPLYVLGSSLLHDTRDYNADPTRGSYQNLSLSVGHDSLRPAVTSAVPDPDVFGTHSYGKSSLDYRQFWSLFGPPPVKPGQDRTTVALRLLAGGSTGRLPFTEQYFLGGGDSLRGYREDRFWGNNMFLSSLELRQPLAPKFKAVAFIDLGEAWGGDYSNLNIAGFTQSNFQPHVGTGVGVRVGTPLGLIRLDLGYGDEGARTHFGIGGSF